MNLITTAAINEVYNSHVLIEEWFHGTEKATPQLLEQLFSVFAADFSMINPAGNELNRHDLKYLLSSMRGARPNVRIEITTPQVILSGDNYCILKYEELQHMEQQILHRMSTAVFISDNNRSVLWHHLHETWVGTKK